MNIPSLHFRSEITFSALQALERIYGAQNQTADYIYSPRYKYVKRSARINVSTIEEHFMKTPASRETSLHLIGLMCHECVHMAFLKQEQNIYDPNLYSNVIEMETEICKFFERLPNVLKRFNSDNLCFTVLKWILNLCVEIANFNQTRANIKLAREAIPYFMKFKSINSLLTLLDSLLTMTVSENTITVVDITVGFFKYEWKFDWIFLHIVTNFSYEFIPRLIEICIVEMRSWREEYSQQGEVTDLTSFPVISDLISFLINKSSPRLRASLIENISGFFEGNKPVESILCIANWIFQYPEIGEMFGEDISRFITERNLITMIKLAAGPDWALALKKPSSMKSIKQSSMKSMNPSLLSVKVLKSLSLNTLIIIFDQLIELLYSSRPLNGYLRLDEQGFGNVCSKIEQFMNDILTTILMKAFTDQNVSFISLPYLDKIVRNEAKYEQMLRDVLDGVPRAKYSAKLLYICCLVGQKKFAIKVLCQLLYNAKSENELINFVAFSRVLNNQFVHIMTDSLTYLVENLKDFETKYRERSGDITDLAFMQNLATLSHWQHVNNFGVGLETVHRIIFSTLDGRLQLALLDFLMRNMERFMLSKQLVDGDVTKFLYEWLGYMDKLGVVDITSLRFDLLIQLIAKLAGIGVILVRFLPETTSDETAVLLACKAYFSFCKKFICTNLLEEDEQKLRLLRWCLSNFCKEFLINVFDMSHDLFGTTPGLIESTEQNMFDDVQRSFLPKISLSAYIADSDLTCLEQLRLTPFIQRKTSALAHSGTISKKHSRFVRKPWSSIEKLRATIVVGFCSNFCDIPHLDNHFWCLIGKTLSEFTCPDALTSTVGWFTWPIEKECILLYIEVTNKVRELPIIYDLLVQISQKGYVATCSALPLIKSMFAAIVNFHGTTPRKTEKLNVPQLEDIARIFSIFFSSGLLPLRYKSLFSVFKSITHHEAYLILVSLWEYINLIVPHNIDELQALCKMEIPEAEFTRKANSQILTTVVTPIIQLHIEELGYLLPDILTEDDNETENDTW